MTDILLTFAVVACLAVLPILTVTLTYLLWLNRKSARRWKPFEYCPACGQRVFWADECGDLTHEPYLVPCGHSFHIVEGSP